MPALADLPDGVERLGFNGVLQALQNMQRKADRDQCFELLRKWGAERRITPQKRAILPEDVEAVIRHVLEHAASGPGASAQKEETQPPTASEERCLKRCKTSETSGAVVPSLEGSQDAERVQSKKVRPGQDLGPAVQTEAPTPVGESASKKHGRGTSRADSQTTTASTEGDSSTAGIGDDPARAPVSTNAKAKKLTKQQRAKEEKEKARRELEAARAEEERRSKELAAPFEGLSLSEMRAKRVAEVLSEMDQRMCDIVRRTAESLGVAAPSDDVLGTLRGQDADCREAYVRLIHTVQEAVPVPEGLQAELMPHQVDGLEWLVSIYVNNLHGILADEMGLGKTIQTIAWLQYLKEFKSNKGPHLIVAPKSTLANWETEFGRFAPTYKVWLLVGDQEEREHFAQKLKKRVKNNQTTVYVTNFEQIHRNEWLQEFDWQCIVIDEGHRMKNQKSVLHATMTKMCCRTRMLLTGTPLQNNLNELWALLHYLLPELFPSTLDFQQWFLEPLRGVNNLNEYEVQLGPEEETQLISRLHTMLSPFLLQRTKAQVMQQQLPPKVEATVRVALSAWQQSAYLDLQKRTIRLLSVEDKVETQKVNNALMQLRKLVLHPYLFMSHYKSNADLYRASGKVEVLDRILSKLLRFGHKTLIFSQFTSVLDILSAYLSWRGHEFLRLDGQTPHEERRKRIATFSEAGSIARIFLLSSRAGGLGLNLQAADTVILFDLDWNPQNDKQAIARAHRFGQLQEVRVLRLLTESGIERHMEQRCREKLELEQKIMGAGMFSKGSSQEQRVDMLKSILGLTGGEAAVVPAKEEATTSPEDLNRLLARNEKELAAFGEMDTEWFGRESSGDEALPPLMRCGRLMRNKEVPDGFRVEEENVEEDNGACDALQ